jgi:hypothetical protein
LTSCDHFLSINVHNPCTSIAAVSIVGGFGPAPKKGDWPAPSEVNPGATKSIITGLPAGPYPLLVRVEARTDEHPYLVTSFEATQDAFNWTIPNAACN